MPKKSAIARLGVLTGGGDCPGLNAVIRAVVRSAVNQHGIKVTGIKDGFEGLIRPNRTMPLDSRSVSGILPAGGTILGTSNRANPFAFPVKVGKERVPQDLSELLLANVKKLGLDALIAIGGDGSLSIARELGKRGLKIVGVPKTIDNDLSATDYTFGFDTAVTLASWALDRLHSTAEAHHRVMVLELMGRDTGWIALYGGIAGGADVILIPEIPFTYQAICAKVRERARMGRAFSLIVAAEGAAAVGELPVYQETKGPGGFPRYGGIAERIASELRTRIENEIRVTVLGHLQRGGSPSARDRILASAFGSYAVKMVVEGKFGRMAALKGIELTDVPLDEACGKQKRVDPACQEVVTARALGTAFGDEPPPPPARATTRAARL
ncbi:MAG: ATP-dependent 6-phosphofructokinase [Acidobacteriota bacterium]